MRPVASFPTLSQIPGVSTAFRLVHLIPGVTGAGTSGSPYVGWETTVNASADGDSWQFVQGVFETPSGLTIAANNVSLAGMGRGTRIRSTGGSSTLTLHTSSNGGLTGLSVRDMILDGNAIAATSFVVDDCNFSTFANLALVGATSWSAKGSRQINNTWQAIVAHGNEGTVAPNGIWLSSTDLANSDNATTVCAFINVEVATGGGTGLKATNACFGNVFVGGAFEGCSVAINLGSGCSNFVFHGTDFESSANPLLIAGQQHRFTGCNIIASVVGISGAGGHVFERCTIDGFTDTGTLSSVFEACNHLDYNSFASIVNGGGTPTSVFCAAGGLQRAQHGTTLNQVISTNSGTVGFEGVSAGARSGDFLVCAGGTYLVDSGGISDFSESGVASIAAIKLVGQDIFFGQTLRLRGAASADSFAHRADMLLLTRSDISSRTVYATKLTASWSGTETDTTVNLEVPDDTGTVRPTMTWYGNLGVKMFGPPGFNGTEPPAKPTISGSRGSNAALASLLTALAGMGLLTDSSS